MFNQNNNTLGTLYIVFGVFLFLSVAGTWLINLGLALVAYHLINYGLSLRGMPPLMVWLMRWLSGTRPY